MNESSSIDIGEYSDRKKRKNSTILNNSELVSELDCQISVNIKKKVTINKVPDLISSSATMYGEDNSKKNKSTQLLTRNSRQNNLVHAVSYEIQENS